MSQAPRVLLAGYGYTSRAIARALLARGVRPVGTTRSPDTAKQIEAEGVAALIADPATPDGAQALRAAIEESTHVLSSIPPARDGSAADPLLGAIGDADLSGRWLGYLSTTGVYGDRGGGWAFEYEPATPTQDRSIRRAAAEAAWSAHGARLFRLSGIYGPGRSALDRVRAGTAKRLDKPGHVFSRIHVDDIASAVVAAMLDRPEASGAFNLADDHPSSQSEVLEGAARRLGVEPPPLEPFDPDAMSPMAASFYAECRRVSNARTKAALGWRPAYPTWREGLDAILAAGG